MGQKANPVGLRVGINRNSDSIWYTKMYAKYILQDVLIRRMIEKDYRASLIAKIIIERSSDNMTIKILAAKIANLIKKLPELQKKISKILEGKEPNIKIEEEKRPFSQTMIAAQSMAIQIEQGSSPKQVMNKTIREVMKTGVLGVKIAVSGRIGGAEIARVEKNKAGTVPLHTLRMNIDRFVAVAYTSYGKIGISVIICHS